MKTQEGRQQITLEETPHRNGHWKRSFGGTEIVTKVLSLCEMHTVDMSIEVTGSMFGKEVTCLSDRVIKRTT